MAAIMTLAKARKIVAANEFDPEIKAALDYLVVEAAEGIVSRTAPVIDDDSGLPVLHTMTKDLLKASTTMGAREASFLVSRYYQMQFARIRTVNQVQALETGEEAQPHAALIWLSKQDEMIENQIRKALDHYSSAHPVGIWARSQVGIGPVLAAGLLAYIDISRAPTSGGIWRFFGFDPSVTWGKGERRPWSAKAKVLGWKIGQSFMKTSTNENAFYGKLYRVRKDYELARNESGGNRELALANTGKVGKETQAYGHLSAGKLPPSQIDARARRWAVKLFLAHWHDVMWEYTYKEPACAPYPMAILGHTHMIEIPNRPRFF